MSGPYEFGDVVDGYRWTVLGWEPVEGSEPAASAALQHALGTRLERPAVTQHARHTSTASLTSPSDPVGTGPAADAVADAVAADVTDVVDGTDEENPSVPPVEGWVETARATDLAPATGPGTEPASTSAAEVPAAADAPEPQLRWTPVGWEVVPPAEPVEEFADVVAAAPSAPPIEAAADLDDAMGSSGEQADPGAGSGIEPVFAETVLDLREPSVEAAAREVTVSEPPAGWYPG